MEVLPDLSAFRLCWEAKILEDHPQEPEKPPATPPQPVPSLTPTAPFTLIACHENPAKSSAILLLDGHQILVRLGCPVGKTLWRVTAIERDCVHLTQGTATVVLERKKNPLLRKSPELSVQSLLRGIEEREARLTIRQGAELTALGFQAQDQIIAVAGKRIYGLADLRQSLEQSGSALTEVSVLRQGRLVAVHLTVE